MARVWVHRLSGIDPETRTATCANCGPVQLSFTVRGDGSIRWRCPIARNQQRGSRKTPRCPEAKRRERLRYDFGLTVERYEEMLAAQGGVCAVCSLSCTTGRRLAVDHCHDKGHIRGLLCRKCNLGIGYLGNAPDRLRLAAEYLVKSPAASEAATGLGVSIGSRAVAD